MKKINSIAEKIEHLCHTLPPLWQEMDEVLFSTRPAPSKWSKKEIIGHLIDSAANNHQRFVRGQFEDRPNIYYNQNLWNECNFYSDLNREGIIELWRAYNLHLASVIKRIPEETLNNIMDRGDEKGVTLGFVIEDYLDHLAHHLNQINSI